MNQNAFCSLRERAINAARRAEHNPKCKKLQDVADFLATQYWQAEEYAIEHGWI